MHVVRGARTTGVASFDLCSKIKGAIHVSYILLYFFRKWKRLIASAFSYTAFTLLQKFRDIAEELARKTRNVKIMHERVYC